MRRDRVSGGNKFIESVLAGFGMLAVSLPATALVIDIDTSVTGTSSATVGALTLIQHGSNVDFRFDNLVNNLSRRQRGGCFYIRTVVFL